MARIAIVTYGTHGDVQPVLGLGAGLIEAGHDVTLLGPPDTIEHSQGHGVPYVPLGDPMRPAVKAAADPARRRVDSDKNAFDFLRRQIALQLEALPELVGRPDMLLAAQLAWGAASVARRAEIPYRYVAYTPQAIPSRRFPPMVSRTPGAPGWVHGLTWRLYRAATNMGFKSTINRWHEQQGMPAIRSVWDHVIGDKVLLACDALFGEHPPGSSPECVQVGFLPAPTRGDQTVSDRLEEFLQAGPPPVYVGFGSMPGADPRKVATTLIEGARRAGKRLVVGGGWGELDAGAASSDVLQIGFEPFSQLFERVEAVVHHGGAGTTATAARAGVPQLIVPHMGDQFFFGHRVWRIGIGAKPIPLAKLTASKVESAIVEMTTSEPVRRKATEVAHDLRRWDGVRRAVDAVEEDLSRLGAAKRS